ncbi:hypothetical protein K461DRAFT_321244 [Myriangium duriaei CBS 260.36]|uniref:Rhodopsin domain-containing protein n=1 Tax=Myriangium duriaei CBS 260.36 TaxID=1168546 RepID=A0A9P4IZ12_9PEZI|nr:hypothetical protein K461DRAFT_321244 [Myriangium duriaei CBS 260.36]
MSSDKMSNSDATMDTRYANWSGDPALAPWTSDIHLPFAVLITNYALAALLTVMCVMVRVYVRHGFVKHVGLDDWVLVAAQVTYLGYIVFLIKMCVSINTNGMRAEYWPTMTQMAFIPISLGATAILVRAAVATFFLRALGVFECLTARVIIIATFWVYAIFTTASTFVNVFQCGNPLNADTFISEYDCLPVGVLYGMIRTNRILNVSLDWVMTLMPVLLVAKSALRWEDKISAIGVLVLAGAGSIISVVGIAFVQLGEITWPSDIPHSFIFTLFSVWENAAVIIVLSLAAMRPLLKVYLRSRKSAQRCRESTSPKSAAADGTGARIKEARLASSSAELSREHLYFDTSFPPKNFDSQGLRDSPKARAT